MNTTVTKGEKQRNKGRFEPPYYSLSAIMFDGIAAFKVFVQDFCLALVLFLFFLKKSMLY